MFSVQCQIQTEQFTKQCKDGDEKRNERRRCKHFNGFIVMLFFWGELIDKHKDINANSKTVFTDYAMLKLVLYSPHMFLLFCQSK